MTSFNLNQGFSQIPPRDEYVLSLAPNKERIKAIVGALKHRNNLDIIVKNWSRYLSPLEEYGTIANLGGNDEVRWAETAATGTRGHPSPVNWVLKEGDQYLAEGLIPEQRVGLLIGADVFGALETIVGKDNLTEKICDFFSSYARKTFSRPKTECPLSGYNFLLPKHIHSLNRDIYNPPIRLAAYHRDNPPDSPVIFPDSKFVIPGLDRKTIQVTSIREKQDVDDVSSYTPLNKGEKLCVVNAIASGFLLSIKPEMDAMLREQYGGNVIE